ncbi:beta strand repeat-containing protein [Aquirufa sp. 5-AUSEE-100C1]
MKRYLLALFLIQWAFGSIAQTKGIQYQAVLQDPNPYQIPGTFIQGQVLQNSKVSIRFTLKSTNNIDFEELHDTQTDAFGLINLTIGKGKKVIGNFEQLNWSGQNKILVVAVKIDGQPNYLEVSNQTLLYSPYALYADAVEYKNVYNAPKDVSHFTNDVGYLMNKDLKPLEKKIEENQTENLKVLSLIKDQQITLENQITEQGKQLNQQVEITQNLNTTIQQQSAQINQNQNILQNQINQSQNNLQNQINNLSGSYESLSNKSTAVDLGNSSPSNQLYPSQQAVKTYVDQVISTVATSGVPDATTLAAGKIKLSGDLSGTASNPTVPGLALKEDLANKSTNVSSDGSSDTKYPSVRAVKTYVDQATQGIALSADLNAKADKNSPVFTGTPNLPTGTIGVKQAAGNNTNQLATTSFVQQELSGLISNKEDAANKSTATSLGTSNTLFPTQNAVKTYVDNQISSATIADASLSAKGKIRLGGDLAAGNSTADDPIIRDNAISTSKLADLAVTDAKIASISGSKVAGNISGNAANVTGTISPSHGGTGVAGTLNGYVRANGISAMQGLSTIPVSDVSGAESASNKSNDIALDANSTTKYPNVSAVKTYVDNQIAQGTIPDATTSTLGRIRLGGDLAGTGTSANNPILSNNSVTSAKIADLAVTNAKIVSVEGSKISSDILVNAANITGVANASHGGTGAAGTLTGYIKGNGLSAMTSSATIPISDVANAENVNNKSTATDLGNSSPSDQLYPSQKAVKSYVDAIAVSSVGSATQNALNLKENTANKSTGDINGNSVTSFPTQSAVKSYVESKLSSQTVALGNLQTINPDKVLGNFGASSAFPSEIATTGTGAVVRNTAATLSNVLLNGSIGGNAILSTTNGGLGTGSLTAGYVKAGTPFSTVSAIPVADVTGAVQKVNGYLPDTNGNIALRFGTTYTGLYNNGNFAPVISSPINSDVFIVSGDPTATNNGRAFIYDGTRWNEITMDQASLDAQYVKLTGSTMQGNLVFPTGKKIQQVDAPSGSTDVANRAYVDQAIAANATSDATNVVFGKIRLGGDLAASSSTAANPIISNGAITSVKIADGAVTEEKLSAPISGAKGGTGVNNTGKTITVGGNLTTIGSSSLTLTTTANTNVTFPTSGTLATLSESESLTNKTINGIQFTSNPTNFSMTGGSLTARTLTVAGTASVSGTNTGDQTIVLSGDLQGSGTGNITTTLNNTGVIAGVYGGNSLIPQITVDAKGRITNVTEINLSNTTLAGTILNDGKFLVGNGSNAAVERSLSGDVTMNNLGVTSIGTGKVTNGMLAGNIDLSTKVSNLLPISNGGTGVSSLTNNALLVGGSTLGFLAPGSSGNILSSNGTQWSSNPISSLGVATSVGNPNSTGTSNGMTLLAGELKLSPADGTNPGIITTGTQSLAGNKTFLQDLSVNQIVLGSGGGNLASNTRIGNSSFTSNTTGSNNTAIGYQSLQANTSGTNNTALGATALALNTIGNGNTAIGNGAGVATGNLSNTIAIGSGAVVSTDNTIQLGNNNIGRLNTSAAIYAASIQNTPIGSVTRSTGAFSSLLTNGTNANQVVYTDANNLLISSSTLPVNLGGTGLSSIPSNGVMIGNGSSGVSTVLPNTTGQVLTWNGTAWTATVPTAISTGVLGTSNTNGISISNNVISLSPADATNPGIITTSAQILAGAKTLTGDLTVNGNLTNASLTASKVVFTDASKNLSSTGIVGVTQGGTGLGTIPTNAILIGNGTGSLSTLTPSSSGQVLTWNGTAWTATVPTAISTGVLGTSNTNGISISNNVISLSPADATNPGIVTTGAQTIAGAKTFENAVNIDGNLKNSTLSASKAVFTDASKILTSIGTLGVDQGGTGVATLTAGALLVGNGTGTVLSTLTPSTTGYVLKVVGGSWTVSTPDRDVSDQFSATANQTTFTLTQIPVANSRVKMYINGVRIDKFAYAWTNQTLTYTPANNSGYALAADDRIQFEYAY